jgi:DNA repair ATPase RecN
MCYWAHGGGEAFWARAWVACVLMRLPPIPLAQELDTSRMREQEMERKVLGLTKALSEARMEASGLGQMADADKRAYFSKKLASQLQAKRAALQQATSRRHELSQKLDQVRRKKPKEAPQEKLKEALRIVAELTYSLSHTTATNKNLREQLEVQPPTTLFASFERCCFQLCG